MTEMHVSLLTFMAGIYLHIPFCRQACHYCDFHFSTNTEIKGALVSAMAEEIKLQRDYLKGESVETIYFGGGTPSLLSAEELELLLETIHQTHSVSSNAEVTLEANPDDLVMPALQELSSLGINRLSIGIQSFNDDILRYLNRVHNAQTAIRSIAFARKAGFTNISIDLIYAIPGLSPEAWQRSIDHAVALDPSHISAYTLTIEEKTLFGNWLAKGKLKAVDDNLSAKQQEALVSSLDKAGYQQYEISNFARPGWESRHNSGYWRGASYLGVGPGAHSFDQTTRQHNITNNHLYVRSLKEKKVPAQKETLKKTDRINEYILTTLRTDQGCNLSFLRSEFNYDLLSTHETYLRKLEHHDLAFLREGHLFLTQPGRLLADKIASDLFLIE